MDYETAALIKRKKCLFAFGAMLFIEASRENLMKKKRKPRSCAVRPANRNRHEEGSFATLVRDMEYLEYNHDQYFKYLRLSPELFKTLLSLVGPSLQKVEKHAINPISPAHRLVMTLHYLAEGCSMQEIAWNFRVGLTTVHFTLKETCQLLWDILSPTQLPVPTKDDWIKISDGFFNRWNLPHCIGAVDGKHVNIQCPSHSGTEFFNYKKTFSLVLMATCDSYYRFTLVDIGASGSNHDSTVFKESGFGSALLNGNLDFPEPTELPNTNIKMGYFIAGDQAFPLHKYIMRPYPGSYLGEQKNTFNYRLSRARRTIENTFGILVQRWRIYRGPIIASLDMCERIVKATIVLHNFIQKSEEDIPVNERRYCPTGYVDHTNENGDMNEGQWRESGETLRSVSRLGSNNAKKSTQAMRDQLSDYLISDAGAVPWQQKHVLAGSIPE